MCKCNPTGEVDSLPRSTVGSQKPSSGLPKAKTDWRTRFTEDLYRNHWNDLCRMARSMFGDGPPEPEDLVQGAFQKWSELDNIDHVENPKAFLAKVAVNNGLKSIKRVQRARKYVAEQLQKPGAGLEEIDPERIYQGRNTLSALDSAMADLTPKQREIIVRNRLRGETYAQISSACGWSEADISRQLHRALKALADTISFNDSAD